jgi:NADH-quinone oxidoreductase subunit J
VELLVFYLFAAVSVGAALLVVLQKRAVYSALALIVCFGSVAALFFQLGAYFIAAIQVIVYAGAIMVLFLFVVMLIDPESEMFALKRTGNLAVVALPPAALFALILFSAFGDIAAVEAPPADPPEMREIAIHLFTDYLLPFEVTAILILVALLGAMVLAKRTD